MTVAWLQASWVVMILLAVAGLLTPWLVFRQVNR